MTLAHPYLGADEAPEPDATEPEGVWRVYSDGTPKGTKVIDPAGHAVNRILNLNFSIDANGLGQVYMEVGHAALTLVGSKAEVAFVCPECRESIEHTCDVPF